MKKNITINKYKLMKKKALVMSAILACSISLNGCDYESENNYLTEEDKQKNIETLNRLLSSGSGTIVVINGNNAFIVDYKSCYQSSNQNLTIFTTYDKEDIKVSSDNYYAFEGENARNTAIYFAKSMIGEDGNISFYEDGPKLTLNGTSEEETY